jgi:hypothetical protein
MAAEETEEPTGKKGKKEKGKKEKAGGGGGGMKPAIVVGVMCMIGFKLFGGGGTTTAATDASAVKPATAKEVKDAEWVAEQIAHCPAKQKWFDNWSDLNKAKPFGSDNKGAQVELGSSTFTLSDDNYVKMTVAVALTSAVPEEKIKKFAADHGSEAKNVARSVISTKSAADLKPPYQSVVICEIAAKTMVEYSDKVFDVYVTEFVVQADKKSGPLTVSLTDPKYAPAHEESTKTSKSEAGTKTMAAEEPAVEEMAEDTNHAADDTSHSEDTSRSSEESHSG